MRSIWRVILIYNFRDGRIIIKRILSIVVMLAFILMAGMPAAHAMEKQSEYKIDMALIYDYFNTINNKDYEANYKLWSRERAAELKDVSKQNAIEKMGMWSVSHVDMGSIELLGDVTNNYYADNSGVSSDSVRKRSYLVKAGMAVLQDNPYFYNGDNYIILTCGDEGPVRKLYGDSLPMPELILKYADEKDVIRYCEARFTDERGGYTLETDSGAKTIGKSIGRMPSSIRVRRVSRGVTQTVNFKTYCKVVACYEVGYNSRHENYHKSSFMAVKTYGWWRTLSPYASQGYDIKDNSDDQWYRPETYDINSSQWSRLMAHIDQVWNVVMVNSDKNIFKSIYATDGSGYSIIQNRGRLYHIQANEFANAGRSYPWIFDYFYSNSPTEPQNGPPFATSAGEIIVCSSHSGSLRAAKPTYHSNICLRCGYHYNPSGHSWYASGNYMICSVCGYSVIAARTPFDNIMGSYQHSSVN